ncbi:MAG: response regulator, partial [Phycisphaerales bacterium]
MTPETVLEDKAPILLVDDQPLNLDALEAVLESPDHELIRAQSAEQAMLALLQRDVAAIVLDIRMPGVSGLELAALIKKRKRTRHIPILFLTAHLLDEKDILRGSGAGAVDYLSKPFNPDILRSKIAVFVDLFRKTRALGAANARLQDEVAERQRAQEALRAANDALEGRVRERTIDLSLANQALRESEQRIRLLLDSVGEGIVGLDARGRATFANPAAAAQLGYRAEELIGVPVDDLLAVVGGESAAAPDDAATAGLGAARVSALRRKNGTTFPVEVMRTPVRSEEGEVTGEVVVFRDLTVRLRWQRRLAAEHAVTRILAGAPGLPDAAPRILARLCETLEARTAELWVPGENGGPLSRAAAYPEAAARESWARGEARDAARVHAAIAREV